VAFSTDGEWADRLAGLVRDGLDRGEQVQYLADTTAPEHVLRTLTDRGVDAASAVRRGQLVVTTAARADPAGPRLAPDAMIGRWHRAVEAALARGHRGLRAIGEPARSARGVGAEPLLEYELRIHHEVCALLPLTAWCFYDRRLVPPDELRMLMDAHPVRWGAAPDPAGRAAGLRVTPLPGSPGFRLSGSAGHENHRVIAAAAAAVSGSPTRRLTLDLSELEYLDIAALAALSRAAVRRRGAPPVRLLGAPPSLRRMLELFPELGRCLEVAAR
jgi:ABC-type transporter Mla MlaB component